MSLIAIPQSAWERGLDWKAIGYHSTAHILALVGVVQLCTAFNWYTVSLAVGLLFMGLTGVHFGAHLLYTHRSYKAAYFIHCLWVVLFALTLQGPIRKLWSALHIRHHKYVDTDDDLYSPTGGRWLWAHNLWTCFMLPKYNPVREVKWLFLGSTPEEKRIIKLLAWQEEYAWHLGLGLGILAPTLVTPLWGDWFGGFFVAGWLRLVCTYHCTWQINSISHLVGSQPYTKGNSSRDAPWWLFGVTSILSIWEAYKHNRHHEFPRDIGKDPATWLLYMLWGISQPMRWVGWQPLVWDLHRYDDDGTLRLLR